MLAIYLVVVANAHSDETALTATDLDSPSRGVGSLRGSATAYAPNWRCRRVLEKCSMARQSSSDRVYSPGISCVHRRRKRCSGSGLADG